ncbi:GPP34 family phosphoprotein [Streptomyces sp. NPDC049915]|uniref:GOLPH3/VPS74 family protein n=1 Tax=Streptomyces sp. NPDC049915 TaxID=3155510 RepID=UPI00344474C5
MTTARDLFITALDVPAGRPFAQGDLSLALAGAELVDLIADETVHLDDDRILPGLPRATGDRLLDEAAAALRRDTPYESVEDWLWRRGRGLAAAYAADLKAQEPGGRRWLPHRHPTPPPDSPDRGRATTRWASREPVLVSLAAALGIPDGRAEDGQEQDTADLPDATVTVLAAVHGALTELAAVRQRRRIEDDAYANVWRGL